MAFMVEGTPATSQQGPILRSDSVEIDLSLDNGAHWDHHVMPDFGSLTGFPYSADSEIVRSYSLEGLAFDNTGLTLLVGMVPGQGYYSIHTMDLKKWDLPIALPPSASPPMQLGTAGRHLFLVSDNFTRGALHVLQEHKWSEIKPAQGAPTCRYDMLPVEDLRFVCSRQTRENGTVTVLNVDAVVVMRANLENLTYSPTPAILSATTCGGVSSTQINGTIYVLGSCQHNGFEAHLWRMQDGYSIDLGHAFDSFGIDSEYGILSGALRADAGGILHAITVTGEKDQVGHDWLRTRYTAWNQGGEVVQGGILATRDALGNEPTGLTLLPMIYILGAEYGARNGSPVASSLAVEDGHGFAAFQTVTGVSTQATVWS